ncbi:hypothetical protein [Saccharothrix syringae]|uniref:Uncharacterized protein n=1 Tax=Saccharothrix syringae TaxID=103733 RepID=A0A5Q0HA61_SACSY|nr:hypothetical protein [Saccharothrix syringae]QFZ23138.1 hypothetical protein EKG83_41975 [Saccharothrix syringae]
MGEPLRSGVLKGRQQVEARRLGELRGVLRSPKGQREPHTTWWHLTDPLLLERADLRASPKQWRDGGVIESPTAGVDLTHDAQAQLDKLDRRSRAGVEKWLGLLGSGGHEALHHRVTGDVPDRLCAAATSPAGTRTASPRASAPCADAS